MENPTLYKKVEITQVVNRTTQDLTSAELSSVNTTVGKFIDLFKQKHI